MVAEAGGRVTTFADLPYTVEQPEILATNGLIHGEMLGLLEMQDRTDEGRLSNDE
jgi:fructose-1,6-bisphosphatase/inositol monophosphatase family enzyme